jgi:hypothetical protein
MDIYDAFSIFLSSEAGILYLAVIGIVEFFLKPLSYKFLNGHRNKPYVKKTILPLVVIGVSIGCAFLISPSPLLGNTGGIVLYGIGAGIVSSWLYRTGISSISKKIGIEQKMNTSLFPPKPPGLGGKDE